MSEWYDCFFFDKPRVLTSPRGKGGRIKGVELDYDEVLSELPFIFTASVAADIWTLSNNSTNYRLRILAERGRISRGVLPLQWVKG